MIKKFSLMLFSLVVLLTVASCTDEINGMIAEEVLKNLAIEDFQNFTADIDYQNGDYEAEIIDKVDGNKFYHEIVSDSNQKANEVAYYEVTETRTYEYTKDAEGVWQKNVYASSVNEYSYGVVETIIANKEAFSLAENKFSGTIEDYNYTLTIGSDGLDGIEVAKEGYSLVIELDYTSVTITLPTIDNPGFVRPELTEEEWANIYNIYGNDYSLEMPINYQEGDSKLETTIFESRKGNVGRVENERAAADMYYEIVEDGYLVYTLNEDGEYEVINYSEEEFASRFYIDSTQVMFATILDTLVYSDFSFDETIGELYLVNKEITSEGTTYLLKEIRLTLDSQKRLKDFAFSLEVAELEASMIGTTTISYTDVEDIVLPEVALPEAPIFTEEEWNNLGILGNQNYRMNWTETYSSGDSTFYESEITRNNGLVKFYDLRESSNFIYLEDLTDGYYNVYEAENDDYLVEKVSSDILMGNILYFETYINFFLTQVTNYELYTFDANTQSFVLNENIEMDGMIIEELSFKVDENKRIKQCYIYAVSPDGESVKMNFEITYDNLEEIVLPEVKLPEAPTLTEEEWNNLGIFTNMNYHMLFSRAFSTGEKDSTKTTRNDGLVKITSQYDTIYLEDLTDGFYNLYTVENDKYKVNKISFEDASDSYLYDEKLLNMFIHQLIGVDNLAFNPETGAFELVETVLFEGIAYEEFTFILDEAKRITNVYIYFTDAEGDNGSCATEYEITYDNLEEIVLPEVKLPEAPTFTAEEWNNLVFYSNYDYRLSGNAESSFENMPLLMQIEEARNGNLGYVNIDGFEPASQYYIVEDGYYTVYTSINGDPFIVENLQPDRFQNEVLYRGGFGLLSIVFSVLSSEDLEFDPISNELYCLEKDFGDEVPLFIYELRMTVDEQKRITSFAVRFDNDGTVIKANLEIDYNDVPSIELPEVEIPTLTEEEWNNLGLLSGKNYYIQTASHYAEQTYYTETLRNDGLVKRGDSNYVTYFEDLLNGYYNIYEQQDGYYTVREISAEQAGEYLRDEVYLNEFLTVELGFDRFIYNAENNTYDSIEEVISGSNIYKFVSIMVDENKRLSGIYLILGDTSDLEFSVTIEYSISYDNLEDVVLPEVELPEAPTFTKEEWNNLALLSNQNYRMNWVENYSFGTSYKSEIIRKDGLVKYNDVRESNDTIYLEALKDGNYNIYKKVDGVYSVSEITLDELMGNILYFESYLNFILTQMTSYEQYTFKADNKKFVLNEKIEIEGMIFETLEFKVDENKRITEFYIHASSGDDQSFKMTFDISYDNVEDIKLPKVTL